MLVSPKAGQAGSAKAEQGLPKASGLLPGTRNRKNGTKRHETRQNGTGGRSVPVASRVWYAGGVIADAQPRFAGMSAPGTCRIPRRASPLRPLPSPSPLEAVAALESALADAIAKAEPSVVAIARG